MIISNRVFMNIFIYQELFTGSKYKFKNEGDVYQLIIMAPKVEDTGKYTIEIGGVSSTAYLNVEGINVILLKLKNVHKYLSISMHKYLYILSFK